MNLIKYSITALLIIFIFSSCEEIYTPKPRAYYRINFPQKTYHNYKEKGEFIMPIGNYTTVDSSKADSGWYNINYPKLNATIYLTYKPNVNIEEAIEESRALVYKHSVKADDIIEQQFFNKPENVYGSIYEIKGNAATSINFHIIDSLSRYLRGSLYFDCKPNKDSLAPSIKFIEEDIKYMMANFKWEEGRSKNNITF
jgi:gliding motility-associated lipoprotein GldD